MTGGGGHNEHMPLRGCVCLVTGASSGIGRATAELLAARGARLLLHGRDRSALASVAARTGGTVLVEDLSQPGAAARLAAAALAAAGQVDLLIANAGAGFAGPLAIMDGSRLAEIVATNLTAPLELTRLLLPQMLERRRGRVIFVTSIAGRTGVAGEAVYAASKAGLDAFAESLRLELRGTGVGVGVLVPGVVATRFFDRRGQPYGRVRPRPLPAEAAAAAIVALAETGRAEIYLPRWLRLPVAVRALAPGLYRRLAGRFGGS